MCSYCNNDTFIFLDFHADVQDFPVKKGHVCALTQFYFDTEFMNSDEAWAKYYNYYTTTAHLLNTQLLNESNT